MSLKAIASELGLSVTTVSRALNGYDDVAEETRKRVEEAANRRGYRPNAAAKRLKTGRANAVGMIFPTSISPFSNSHFSETLAVVDHQLAKHEIDLLLLADKPQDNQRNLIRMLRSRALDGIILTHTTPLDARLQRLQQTGFHFLALGRSDLTQPYAWFDFDNHAGSALAVAHCLQAGMTRIAWLGGNESCTFVRDRRQGFHDALGDQTAYAVAQVSASRREGYQQTCAWLAQPLLPQAIIADCSALAEGAALALHQAGKQAITLIAWDGLPRDAVIDVPIGEIRQATPRETGEQIAEMVLQMLEGVAVSELQTLWQPELHFPSHP